MKKEIFESGDILLCRWAHPFGEKYLAIYISGDCISPYRHKVKLIYDYYGDRARHGDILYICDDEIKKKIKLTTKKKKEILVEVL